MRALVLAVFVTFPATASALEIRETQFWVYQTVDGEEVSEETATVPMNPGTETCWNWFIRSAESTGSVTFTERLVMPEAPESWGDLHDIPKEQIGPIVLEQDGKVGILTRKVALDDGWFGHGWCLVAGDPLGPHHVEVTVDGDVIHRFDFEVVALPEPPAPARVLRRSDRAGRFSL